MTSKNAVFNLREYLNIYPNGNVMKKFRAYDFNIYPYDLDYWSEETSLKYLISNSDFILESLKNPGEKDDKIWLEKIKNLILDEIFLYSKR